MLTFLYDFGSCFKMEKAHAEDCAAILLQPLISVTRFGDFLNSLATNFIAKVAQMFSDFLGSCEKHCFLSQTS